MIDLEKRSDKAHTQSTILNRNEDSQKPVSPSSSQSSTANDNNKIIYYIVALIFCGLIIIFAVRTCSNNNSLFDRTTVESKGTTQKRSFGQFSYQRYMNFRGWNINVPSFMRPRNAPENNDGLSFYWDSRNYLQAYGCYNYGVTIDELYLDDIANTGSTVEYKVKKSSWYVLSGHTGDGLIYYKKVAFINHDGLDVIATAMLIYEPIYKSDFDPIIKQVFSKFPK